MPSPPGLESELRDRLRGTAHLPASGVTEILDRHDVSLEELLVALLPRAAERARAPISGFPVGAAALGMPREPHPPHVGAIYLGANLEFAGLPLSTTVHAEQSAVNNAWLHNESGVRMLAVTAAPCGHCRQFLYELTTADDLAILIANASRDARFVTRTSLIHLLPNPFGPRDLGLTAGLMSTPHAVPAPGADRFQLARLAGESSYCPYSHILSGAAVGTRDGRVFLGHAAENAAFNPSLPALCSALSRLSLETASNTPWDIQWAVVSEDPVVRSSPVGMFTGFGAFSAAILQSIAPSIRLQTSLGIVE